MSDDAKWIIGLGIPIVLLLLAALWKMLDARINAEIKALWDQIGRSSKEGMRESVHDSEGYVRVLTAHSQMTDQRLVKIEGKVFNGHER